MEFRFAAYDPKTDKRLYQLPRANSVQIGDTFGTRGTLELKYSAKAIDARDLPTFLKVQAEVTFDNGHTWAEVGPSLLRLSGEHEDTDQAGMRTLRFVGREWILDKARVGTGELELIDGKRPFYQSSPGRIIRTLILEAQDRGAAQGIKLGNFTTDRDAAGNLWPKVATIYYSPGLPIASVLENLVEQGMCDYRMDGDTLNLYAPETAMGRDLTDRANPVRVHSAVTEAPVKYSLEDLASSALLIGDEGFELEVDNPSAPDDYGRLEVTIEQGGVSDPGTARIMVDEALQRGSREIKEITRTQSSSGAAFLPYRDYRVGDYVQVLEDGQWQKYRVRELQLTRDGQDWTIHAVINDRLQELLLKLAKRTNGIVNGTKGSGGDGTRPTPPENPGIEPAAPEGLIIDQMVYLDRQGIARGQITAGWGAVTESTKGQAVEIGGYELWTRRNETRASWVRAASTDGDLTATHSPVVLSDADGNALEYQWRVRAIAQASNRPGPWSDTVTLTMTQDTEPPSVPSLPTVETDLRIITVDWDGLDESAEAMPVDFNHLRIYFAAAEDMAGADRVGSLTQRGTWTSGSMPADVPVWVAVSAVDHVGNESAMTPAQSVTPKKLVDDQSIRDAVEGIDGKIDQAVSDLNEAIDNIVIDANGTTTYWMPTAPDATTDPAPKTGDLWFDTSEEGKNELHRFDGQEWVSAADERIDTIQQAQHGFESDLDEVRTSASGKNSVHYSPRLPSEDDPGIRGDVWWVGEARSPARNIVMVGDSITEGTGTSSVENRWQTILQRSLSPDGPEFPFIPARSLAAISGYPVEGSGAVVTSGVSLRWGFGWRCAEIQDHTVEGGDPGSIEFTFTGTSATLIFASGGLSGIASISVDGSEAVEFNTNSSATGGANYGLTWDTGQLQDGVHTVLVARSNSSSSGHRVWVEGLLTFRNDEQAGTRLIDSGKSGIATTFWTDDSYRLTGLVGTPTVRGAFQTLDAIDLVCIALGTNDYAYAVTPAEYQQNIELFISRTREAGYAGKFLLIGMYMGLNRDPAHWDEYHQAMKRVASTDTLVEYLDLRTRVPSPSDEPGNFADSVHPSDAGHLAIANAVEPYMRSEFVGGWVVSRQFVHDGDDWNEAGIDGQVIANLDAGKIVSGYIDSARIKAGSLVADTILVPGSVGSTVIHDGAITTDKIAAGAITADSGVIASLDAGTITVGEMDGDRIAANTVTADKLLIGELSDLAPSIAQVPGEWEVYSPARVINLSRSYDGKAIQFMDGADPRAFGPLRPTKPGDQWHVGAFFENYSGGSGQGWLGVYFYTASRSYITLSIAAIGSNELSGIATAPAGAAFARVAVRLSGNASGGPITARDIHGARLTGSTLIEDGAITTDKILANAITAGKIAALAIEADHISANAITADKIKAGAIDGKLITGARIRTAASGRRTELDVEGLKSYDSSGNTVLTTQTSDGSIDMRGILSQTISGVTLRVGVGWEGDYPGVQWSDSNIYNYPPGVGLKAVDGETSKKETLIQGPGVSTGNSYLSLKERGERFRLRTWKGPVSNPDDWIVEGNLANNLMRVGSSSSNAPYMYFRRGTGSTGAAWIGYNHPTNGGYASLALRDRYIWLGAYDSNGNVVSRLWGDADSTALTAGTRDLSLFGRDIFHTADRDIVLNAKGTGIYTPGIPEAGEYAHLVRSNGVISWLRSSRRYKIAEEPIESTVESFEDKLLSVDPKTWYPKQVAEKYADYLTATTNGDEPDQEIDKIGRVKRLAGLMAEDLDEAGLGIFVTYDDEGNPDAVMYDGIAPALIPIIRRMRDRIDQLEKGQNQ